MRPADPHDRARLAAAQLHDAALAARQVADAREPAVGHRAAAAPAMTATAEPRDLTARVFRALFTCYDLRTIGGTHIAVPKGTPCFAGPSLAGIARQISEHAARPAGHTCPAAAAAAGRTR